jgi:argininosuccinate lyase
MSEAKALQWGGRFANPPDAALIAFGSSLEDDLVLAPFDAEGSRAHVASLAAAHVISHDAALALDGALALVADETLTGDFAAWARAGGYEDVHGAIDARVRELEPEHGERLHAGRSRNDQVATALLLYARDRAEHGRARSIAIARLALERARAALAADIVLAATTHWQPAQPISLAFWLEAVAEMFARSARRFARVRADAERFSPLGSGAVSGSTLPLERRVSASKLGFGGPSRNALDAIGDRDVALDLLHAAARGVIAASRVSEELVIWCTPAFGYARLDDEASTGSSLMPQKRNPDPFELVRGNASRVTGALAGALGTVTGIALSYHRDLQETKSLVIRGTERALATLDAFERAFRHVRFNAEAMEARSNDGYVVATDLADALIAAGVSARSAHAAIGSAVARADREGRALNGDDLATIGAEAGLAQALVAPLDPRASIDAKRTHGSTHAKEVRGAIESLERELDTL